MFTKQKQDGFSLIEVSIILIIAGLILSAFIQSKQIVLSEQKRSEFYSAVEISGDTLEQFALINGFYPVPASLTEPINSANYGKPISDYAALPNFPAQCAPGSAMVNGVFCRPGRRDLNGTGGAGNVVEETVLIGALPTSIIGMNSDESADMFAQRFTYAVSRNLTDPTTYNDSNGVIQVVSNQMITDANPNNDDALATNRNVHYVIVSHGLNQSGSYGLNTGAIGTACTNATVDPLERENCDVDSVFLAQTNSSLPDADAGTVAVPNDSVAESVLDANGDYYDDAIAFTRTVRGTLWTARGTDVVNMTSGNSTGSARVIIGSNNYSHWSMDNSWEEHERPQLWVNGSARAEQAIAKRLCDQFQDNCFKINDLVDPTFDLLDEKASGSKTTKCNFTPLNDLDMMNQAGGSKHGRTGEAQGECESIVKFPASTRGSLGGTGTICANGASGVQANGTLLCY